MLHQSQSELFWVSLFYQQSGRTIFDTIIGRYSAFFRLSAKADSQSTPTPYHIIVHHGLLNQVSRYSTICQSAFNESVSCSNICDFWKAVTNDSQFYLSSSKDLLSSSYLEKNCGWLKQSSLVEY